MQRFKFAFFFAVLSLGLCALGDEWRFCGTATAHASALATDLNGANWSNDGGTTKAVPQSGEDYVIANNLFCGFGADDDVGGTFVGKSLTLGDGLNNGYLRVKRNDTWSYTFPNLIIKKGYVYTDNMGGTVTLDGDITIESSDTSLRSNGGYGGPVAIGATMHGDSGAQMTIRKVNNSGSDYFKCYMNGDLSDYRGTLVVGGDDSYKANVYFKDSWLGGTLKVCKSGLIYANGPAAGRGEFTVANLTLEADSTYRVSVNATTGSTIRVLNALTLPASGTAKVSFSSFVDLTGSDRVIPLLIAPAGTGMTVDKFSFVGESTAITSYLSAGKFSVGTDAAGNEVLQFKATTVEPGQFVGSAVSTGSAAATDLLDKTKWGDGTAELSGDIDYFINGGRYCGFGAGTFPGKSLTLGDGSTSGNLECRQNGNLTCDFGNLIINRGEIYSAANSGTSTIAGDVTINASSDSPARIRNTGAVSSRMSFTGAFHGSGCLRVMKTFQNYDTLLFSFLGDMSDFTGEMEIGDPTAQSVDMRYSSPVLIGATTFGGTITLNPNGIIGACGTGSNYTGEFSVKNLAFADGAMYRIAVSSTTGCTIRVTQALALPAAGHVRVELREAPSSNTAVRRVPILIAPAATAMTADQFVLSGNGASGIALTQVCSFDVETLASGEKALVLVMDKYTTLEKGDDWSHSCWDSTGIDHWTGYTTESTIDPDTVYVSYGRQVVSPNGQTTATFGGKRLVLYQEASTFLGAGVNLVIPDFVLMSRARVNLRMWSSSLSGAITVTPNSSADAPDTSPQSTSARVYGNASIVSCDGRTVTLNATIGGAGGLSLFGSKDISGEEAGRATSGATFVLKGDNSAFSGSLLLSNEAGCEVPDTKVRITSANQLGGAKTAFAYDALKLRNGSGVQADATLALTEPTRGIYVEGVGSVLVPDEANTLTLASQLTLSGRLVKYGAGTVALGGAVKFTSAQSDTPLAGTNVLAVAEGWVRPAAKTGADGLKIRFAAGTGLRLSSAETDADVRAFGLYDVKETAPFDLTETDGKLNVTVEGAAAGDLAICTVATSAAAALDGNISVKRPKGYKLGPVTAVDNGDGTTTFKTTLESTGLLLLFR